MANLFSSTQPTLSLKDQITKQQQPLVSASDVDLAKQAVWKDNEYLLIETEQRNVIFLGKTRSGKTTAVGVLKEPCYEPEEYSLFSGTVYTKFQSFSIKDNRSGAVKQYTINVIDTPGVFEVKEIGKQHERRTDDEIVAVITDCLRNEVTKINVVVMFASFETGVSMEDVQAIAMFIKLFGNKSANVTPAQPAAAAAASSSSSVAAEAPAPKPQKLQIALCITRADGHDLAWQELMISQLKKHAVLGPLIEENDVKICFIGAVEPQSGRYFNLQHLFQGYAHVYQMRTKLLSMILESSSSRQLLDLDLMTKAKEELIKSMLQMSENFKYFRTVKDWKVQQVQERIIGHKAMAKVLAEKQNFVSVPELAGVFTELVQNAQLFFNDKSFDIEDDARAQLVWPLTVNAKK